MWRANFCPRGFRERGLDLEAGASGILAGPRRQECGALGVRGLKDFQKGRGNAVCRVRRFGNGVAGQEIGRIGVKVEFFEGADFPERLEPVVAAFAVELTAFALDTPTWQAM